MRACLAHLHAQPLQGRRVLVCPEAPCCCTHRITSLMYQSTSAVPQHRLLLLKVTARHSHCRCCATAAALAMYLSMDMHATQAPPAHIPCTALNCPQTLQLAAGVVSERAITHLDQGCPEQWWPQQHVDHDDGHHDGLEGRAPVSEGSACNACQAHRHTSLQAAAAPAHREAGVVDENVYCIRCRQWLLPSGRPML